MSEDTYILLLKKYEEKLKELMTPEDFEKFSIKLGKMSFAHEVDKLEDEDIKQFIKDNWNEITGGDR